MRPETRANFERLLKPRHIAFIGGTDALIAIGEARRRGYQGEVWPVNPKRAELGGVPCFASLDDLPSAPDAVFLAIPATGVIEVVRQLAEMGAGGIVCYSAGFREAGEEGAELEDALRGAVGDMVLVGPNCYGLINYINDTALWPFAHGGSSPGYGAAIVTQSGMFSSDITMAQRSLPMAYMLSVGNQAVNGIEAYVDLLHNRPEVRAIGLHIEGLQDVPRFERIALKALEHGTPIVALKTGTSAIGSALAVSHTGSLAGTNAYYEALFERVGIISVSSPAQMLETLKYLCVVGVPTSGKVAGFTCSGGGAAMLADHAEIIGLEFPEFDDPAARELRALLPDIATVSNPLDYTTPIWGQPEHTKPVFSRAMESAELGAAVLVQDYPAPGLDESQIYYRNDAVAFAEAASERGLPAAICSTLPENMDAETRELLIENGVAPMQGLQEALNAIYAANHWREAKERVGRTPPAALLSLPAIDEFEALDEADSKAWLGLSRIAVPKGRCVVAAETANAAEVIGYPVTLKMMSPNLPHKTEAGAIALNIGDADALTAALEAMRVSVAAHDPRAVTDRFLVEEMSPAHLAELLIGIRRDPQFGLTMTLGSGGVLVELVDDVVTLLLPTNVEAVSRALEGLKIARILKGFRGGASTNMMALAETLSGFAASAVERASDIEEIEINPLFVYTDSVVAVDALMRRVASKD